MNKVATCKLAQVSFDGFERFTSTLHPEVTPVWLHVLAACMQHVLKGMQEVPEGGENCYMSFLSLTSKEEYVEILGKHPEMDDKGIVVKLKKGGALLYVVETRGSTREERELVALREKPLHKELIVIRLVHAKKMLIRAAVCE